MAKRVSALDKFYQKGVFGKKNTNSIPSGWMHFVFSQTCRFILLKIADACKHWVTSVKQMCSFKHILAPYGFGGSPVLTALAVRMY